MPEQYRREVPKTPGLYLMRHGGQAGVTIVRLTEKGRVESLGSAHLSDGQGLIDMEPVHYEFGPKIELSSVDGREHIALADW